MVTEAKTGEQIQAEVEKLDGQAGLSPVEQRIVDIIGGKDPEHTVELYNELNKINEIAGLQEDLLQDIDPNSINATNIHEMLYNLARKKRGLIKFESVKNGKVNTAPEKKEHIQKIVGDKNLSKISGSDVLLLQKQGVDLVDLLLVDEKDPAKNVSSSTIQTGDSFNVNFGNGENLNSKTGAGDILPTTVHKIKITKQSDGTVGEYKLMSSPRPGYYRELPNRSFDYGDIHDGDKIEIMEMGPERDMSKQKQEWLNTMRLNDVLTGESEILEGVDDPELVKQKQQIEENRKKWGSYNTFRRESFENTFGDVLKEAHERFFVPTEVVMKLFEKESSFNPNIKNPGSSAYGLGQIIDETWAGIQGFTRVKEYRNEKKGGLPLDRYNPEDQIIASFAYIDSLKDEKDCSWGDAMVYYHTGPNFGQKNVAKAMDKNPQIATIAKKMFPGQEIGKDEYMKAAGRYYEVDKFS